MDGTLTDREIELTDPNAWLEDFAARCRKIFGKAFDEALEQLGEEN